MRYLTAIALLLMCCATVRPAPPVNNQKLRQPAFQRENIEIEKIRQRYCTFVHYLGDMCKDIRLSRRTSRR